MDGKAGDPPFFIWDFQGDIIVKAYAKFVEVLTDGYFLNGLSVFGVKFANEVPLWRHLYGQHNWWPPILFGVFQGDLTNGSLCKVWCNSDCWVLFKGLQSLKYRWRHFKSPIMSLRRLGWVSSNFLIVRYSFEKLISFPWVSEVISITLSDHETLVTLVTGTYREWFQKTIIITTMEEVKTLHTLAYTCIVANQYLPPPPPQINGVQAMSRMVIL